VIDAAEDDFSLSHECPFCTVESLFSNAHKHARVLCLQSSEARYLTLPSY
jgi:hypothetical protein